MSSSDLKAGSVAFAVEAGRSKHGAPTLSRRRRALRRSAASNTSAARSRRPTPLRRRRAPVATDDPWGRSVGTAIHHAQERRCCCVVSTPKGAIPRLHKLIRGPRGQLVRKLVICVELAPVPRRLLEVVSDDLVVLAGLPLEPVGATFMELGPRVLCQRGVRGVAEQEVAEAERLIAKKDERSGQSTSFRISDAMVSSRSSNAVCGSSSASALRWKSFPMTDARSTRSRSGGRRASTRAASSALLVGGIGKSATSASATHEPSTGRSTPSSTSVLTSSSMKSGLCSVASAIRRRAPGSRSLRGGDSLSARRTPRP